jgi:putative salt-induced outer membrane protein YdiY
VKGAPIAAIVAATTAALGADHASAGIQNVQSALATEAPEGASGSLAASADWRTGNVSFLFLTAAATARYKRGPHLAIALVQADRRTSGEDIFIERSFEHLRYRYSLSERWLVEGFGQHEYDGLRRLRIRALGGLGPRVELLSGAGYQVGLGVAYMLELEELQDDGEIDAGESDLAHRVSSYLVGSYELNDRFQMVETFYAQPRVDEGDDIRLLNETSVVLKATDKISFTTSFVVAYDSRPPATIEKLDTALTTTMGIAFGG